MYLILNRMKYLPDEACLLNTIQSMKHATTLGVIFEKAMIDWFNFTKQKKQRNPKNVFSPNRAKLKDLPMDEIGANFYLV